MGSDFAGEYRKKSPLTLILLLFQGRAKYVTLPLLMAAASLIFVAGSSLADRISGMPPVASFLRTMGMDSLVSPQDFKDSGKSTKNAAKLFGSDTYRRVAPGAPEQSPPCGSECGNNSSLGMIRGDIYGRDESGGKNRVPPGRITGAQNSSDAGYKAGIVDFGSIPPEGGGSYGGVMGEAVRGAPYLSRSAFSSPAGTISRGDSLYASAMRKAGDSVPVPERPGRSNTRKMGRVSDFGWDNADYKTRGSLVDKRPGSRSPISQLADVFSVTNSAFESGSAEPEYQAGYSGAAYDGNDVNLDILVAADEPLRGIEEGFVDNLGDMQQMQSQVKKCSAAQSVYGSRMSAIGKEMDDIQAGMTNPPLCSGAAAWNQKVNNLSRLCMSFNANQSELAKACQSTNGDQMGCALYQNDTDHDGLIIRDCRGEFAPLLTILLLPLTVPAAIIGAIPSSEILRYRSH